MAEHRRTSPLENIPPMVKAFRGTLLVNMMRGLAQVRELRPTVSHARLKLNASQCRKVQQKWIRRLVAPTAAMAHGKQVFREAQAIRDTRFSKGLAYAGAAVTAYAQLKESPATTALGKGVDAALAGTVDLLLDETLAAPIDAVAYFGLEAVGIDPKGWSIGDSYNAGIHAAVAFGETAITGDTTAAATYQERAAKGEYGPPARALAALGDDIAKGGLGSTLAANVSFYFHGFRLTQ